MLNPGLEQSNSEMEKRYANPQALLFLARTTAYYKSLIISARGARCGLYLRKSLLSMSLRVLATTVITAKTDEPIEMSFGEQTYTWTTKKP